MYLLTEDKSGISIMLKKCCSCKYLDPFCLLFSSALLKCFTQLSRVKLYYVVQ